LGVLADEATVLDDEEAFRFDRQTGVDRFRFEQRFNGCSLVFIDRSNGLASSLIDVDEMLLLLLVGIKRQ
jgi:hypothetical protein